MLLAKFYTKSVIELHVFFDLNISCLSYETVLIRDGRPMSDIPVLVGSYTVCYMNVILSPYILSSVLQDV